MVKCLSLQMCYFYLRARLRVILHSGKYGMSLVMTVNLSYVLSNLQMPEM
jgi:hypothetical protein